MLLVKSWEDFLPRQPQKPTCTGFPFIQATYIKLIAIELTQTLWMWPPCTQNATQDEHTNKHVHSKLLPPPTALRWYALPLVGAW